MPGLALLIAGCVCGCMSLGGADSQLTASHSAGPPAARQTVGLLTVLNDEAQVAAFQAEARALSAQAGGVPVKWEGGAASGSVTPGPIHVVNTRTCRDVVHVATKERERFRGRSTHCLDNDGAWVPLGGD